MVKEIIHDRMLLNKIYNSSKATRFCSMSYRIAGAGLGTDFLRSLEPKHTLIVIDKFIYIKYTQDLKAFDKAIIVKAEPDLKSIVIHSSQVSQNIKTIVAIGGGSSIDTAKILKARIIHGEDFLDLGYKLGGNPWELQSGKSPRFVAIPTIPGSGSEASRYAVYYNGDHNKSVIRGWELQPDLCILDPLLARTLTEVQLVSGCFDIFVHAWETHHSKTERERTVMLISSSIISQLCDILLWHLRDPAGNQLVDKLPMIQELSYLGGMCISNVRTGILHCLGEAASAFTTISHPLSLALFYRSAWCRYDVMTAYGMLHKPSLEGHLFPSKCIEMWDKLFAVHGISHHLSKIASSLAPYADEIVEIAMRDQTLMTKEDPFAPVAKSDVQKLVKESLG
jgi:alcohol dehydrogenase class IV